MSIVFVFDNIYIDHINTATKKGGSDKFEFYLVAFFQL